MNYDLVEKEWQDESFAVPFFRSKKWFLDNSEL